MRLSCATCFQRMSGDQSRYRALSTEYARRFAICAGGQFTRAYRKRRGPRAPFSKYALGGDHLPHPPKAQQIRARIGTTVSCVDPTAHLRHVSLANLSVSVRSTPHDGHRQSFRIASMASHVRCSCAFRIPPSQRHRAIFAPCAIAIFAVHLWPPTLNLGTRAPCRLVFCVLEPISVSCAQIMCLHIALRLLTL